MSSNDKLATDLMKIAPDVNPAKLALAEAMVPELDRYLKEEEGYDASYIQQFTDGVRDIVPNLENYAVATGRDLDDAALLVSCLDVVVHVGNDVAIGHVSSHVQENVDELVSEATESGCLYDGFQDAEDMASSISNGGIASQLAFLLAGNGLPTFRKTVASAITDGEPKPMSMRLT